MSKLKYLLLTEDGYEESALSYENPYDMSIFNTSCGYNVQIIVEGLKYHSREKMINFNIYCFNLKSIKHEHMPDLDGEYLWNNSLTNLRYDNPELFNRLKYIRDNINY